ncbi:MAG: hypothetical protein JWP89_3726 [Schlesneria sp.]|nr:hypothetical protein [Schlesneria sp.]
MREDRCDAAIRESITIPAAKITSYPGIASEKVWTIHGRVRCLLGLLLPSFPRRRESSRSTSNHHQHFEPDENSHSCIDTVPSFAWIPACAGMTEAFELKRPPDWLKLFGDPE